MAGARSRASSLRPPALGVSRGQRLDAQAAVGTGGLNPAGNPALYFELRVDGAAVDPLQWLKKQR